MADYKEMYLKMMRATKAFPWGKGDRRQAVDEGQIK